MLKKLATETALYGLSSMVGRMLNFLLITLYTHHFYGFAPQEYGALTYFYTYVAFLNIIFVYGLETAFFRYANKTDKPLEVYNLLLSYLIISTFFFTIILYSFSDWLVSFSKFPAQGYILRWIAIILAVDTLLALPYSRLRFEKKARWFVLTKLGNILITIFLNIFFLVICREIYDGKILPTFRDTISSFYNPAFGVGYVFLANLIANTLNILWLYACFIDFRFRFNWQVFRPILSYAYPLALMGLAGIVSQLVANLLIPIYLPDNFYEGRSALYALGIYGACFKLSVLMSLAIQSFKYAAEPFFFSKAQDKNSPALFAKVMYYFVVVCVLLWLGVCLNLFWIKDFVIPNKRYHEGLGIVPILLLANLFLGMYYNFSFWFKITEKTYYGTWISVAGAVFTVIFNIILIPIFGYVACAWVTLASYAGMAWVCYAWGQKFYPVPYQILPILAHIFLGGILIIISNYLPKSLNFWATLAINFTLFVVYLSYVFFTEKQKR